MDGLMMDCPLVIPGILDRAARLFGEKEVVSRRDDGTIHRYTYGDLRARVLRLMDALRRMGVRPGDRVATFAWNHDRHLELYFAVPSLGAVLHTINPRLARDQIRFIINHAEDRAIFADRALACALAEMQGDLPTVRDCVIMDDRGAEPPALPSPSVDYEDLLKGASERAEFPALDERAAAGLCYTSGTTGDPKGVLYSHRSVYLHAMAGCMVDTSAIGEREVVMPVVPMFHVNAWGAPYACALAGAKLVFPGSQLQEKVLAGLIEAERVTLTSGVPTIWNRLYSYLKQNTHDLSSLHTIFVGGSAVSTSLIENFGRDFGVTVMQGWGMTETSPVGTVSRLRSTMDGWPEERKLRVRAKQGMPVISFEARILDDRGEDLPWDGEHAGELAVRGPWVARAYYRNPEADAAFTADGWFRTGDIAKIDPMGYMQITDRKKDLIKRKGEWISSVDMENAAQSHPGVVEAGVVGRLDACGEEAPVVFAVRRADHQPPVEPADIIDWLARTFARWQLPKPEDVRFVDALPRTGVGKIDKKVLRRMLAGA
jgi:fatty-acyl-CoA synthase